ncbi:MAG: hypothetical protein AMXMBFR84_41090 [Candidatus Hydrogenedentota bacterium]
MGDLLVRHLVHTGSIAAEREKTRNGDYTQKEPSHPHFHGPLPQDMLSYFDYGLAEPVSAF